MQNMGVGPFGARPERPPAQPAPKAAAPEAPAPGGPGSDEAGLRSGLLALLPRARDRSLFVRLGLAEGAPRDEVKRAFLQIARRFHPDRFAAPALADMKEEVSAFFTAVNEAYEILTDDKKRAEYLAASKAGSTNPQRAESARVDFQKGEACIRTRDFARARTFLESAIRADARAEYQAALAWTYLVDQAGKDPVKARALLAEASKDPGCDRARYVAGVLARDEGNEVEAERAFRAALAINPGHADAARELKHLEGRRSHRRGP
jgi:curved DNA-binding protein CbpA